MDDEMPVAAGRFAVWLDGMARALDGREPVAVPCAGCTACCTSFQFVHIEPDETATLARIPAELLFPAPGRPEGHLVLGYDERGHCPMLVDGTCTIYDDRPRTCRTYDCRVFPATGVEIDDERQVAVAQRARRWHFDVATDDDRAAHDALRAAARSVPASVNATERAVLAIRRVVSPR